jgi:hypothetical protein
MSSLYIYDTFFKMIDHVRLSHIIFIFIFLKKKKVKVKVITWAKVVRSYV